MGPSRRARYLFWLIAACFSVFFAEVVSGSYMFPFVTPWGLLVLIPLYGLHLLVLAWAVYRFGRPFLYVLFPAGVLFGLYEAYITKVLWSPPWNSAAFSIGGVAVFDTLALILFWHPLMAFIIPLFVSESILTRSHEVLSGLPGRIDRPFLSEKSTYAAVIGLALLCGINQGTYSPSPAYSIGAALLAGGPLCVLIFIFRRLGLHQFEIRQLLPAGREPLVLIFLLFLLYLAFGIGLRPEALPGLVPQAVIWLLYACFIGLLYLDLKKSMGSADGPADFRARFSWPWLITFFVIFALTSALVSLIYFRAAFIVLFWIGGITTGLALLAYSVRQAVRGNARAGP